MQRTQIGFGGMNVGKECQKIANISIVSSWAMVFFTRFQKQGLVECGLKIQRTKVCELQTLIVNKEEKDDPC